MIYFKDEFGIYRVYGYDAILEKETFSTLINRLGKEIESDKQRANFLSKMPLSIQNLLFLSNKYNILCQYIDNHYINDNESLHPEKIERLYNL